MLPDEVAAEKTFAETEEETIRLKSLSDLTFPSPPENAAQARGYINQVLMATGKVQRMAGEEVYIWAQDCMTLSVSAAGRTRDYPFRGDAKWARAIFRQFQLERDRIGMLAERNLMNTKLAGGSLQDLEDFRDRYLYVLTTIPKPSTMFNHLIDELDKCPTLKQKVEQAKESRPGSHRRTTEWL